MSRSDAGLPMIIPDASRSFLYAQNENLKKSSFGVPGQNSNLLIQSEALGPVAFFDIRESYEGILYQGYGRIRCTIRYQLKAFTGSNFEPEPYLPYPEKKNYQNPEKSASHHNFEVAKRRWTSHDHP